MRLLPRRRIQPQDPAADKAKLQERLDRLADGSATPEATAPIPSSPAEPEPVVQAVVPARPAPTVEPAAPALTGELVVFAAPVTELPLADYESDRRRRRRFGFLLFFASLIFVFFAVRAIPADWEVGPFRIDASGSAADSAASIYFSDDPHAPFWLLVPTFNLPPRFFAARPNSSARPLALAPRSTPTPAPSGTPSPSGSTNPSASPSVNPSGSASPSASPSPSPSGAPTPTPSGGPTPTPSATP